MVKNKKQSTVRLHVITPRLRSISFYSKCNRQKNHIENIQLRSEGGWRRCSCVEHWLTTTGYGVNSNMKLVIISNNHQKLLNLSLLESQKKHTDATLTELEHEQWCCSLAASFNAKGSPGFVSAECHQYIATAVLFSTSDIITRQT